MHQSGCEDGPAGQKDPPKAACSEEDDFPQERTSLLSKVISTPTPLLEPPPSSLMPESVEALGVSNFVRIFLLFKF